MWGQTCNLWFKLYFPSYSKVLSSAASVHLFMSCFCEQFLFCIVCHSVLCVLQNWKLLVPVKWTEKWNVFLSKSSVERETFVSQMLHLTLANIVLIQSSNTWAFPTFTDRHLCKTRRAKCDNKFPHSQPAAFWISTRLIMQIVLSFSFYLPPAGLQLPLQTWFFCLPCHFAQNAGVCMFRISLNVYYLWLILNFHEA